MYAEEFFPPNLLAYLTWENEIFVIIQIFYKYLYFVVKQSGTPNNQILIKKIR